MKKLGSITAAIGIIIYVNLTVDGMILLSIICSFFIGAGLALMTADN